MSDDAPDRAPKRRAIGRSTEDDPERAQAVQEILERLKKRKESEIEDHN